MGPGPTTRGPDTIRPPGCPSILSGAGRFDPSRAIWQDQRGISRRARPEDQMKVEANLEDLYRTNASGAHYISHFPVQGMLFLSGTVPIKDGKPYLPGVVGESLTLEQGYEAARYAALTTLEIGRA